MSTSEWNECAPGLRSTSLRKFYLGANAAVVGFFVALAVYPSVAIPLGYWSGGFIAPVWQIVLFGVIAASALTASLVVADRFQLMIAPLEWAAIVGLGVVLYFRMGYDIYDLVNPTDLLGGVVRAANGLIPYSFTNFPEFCANYHAAFIVAASMLRRIFGLSAIAAIVTLYLSGLVALSWLVLWWLRRRFGGGPIQRVGYLGFFLFVSTPFRGSSP